MKTLTQLFNLMTLSGLCLAIMTGCSKVKSPEASNVGHSGAASNTLAIYLAADKDDAYHLGKDNPIFDDKRLEPKPILCDYDFVWFNTNTQQFAITADAARRLIRRLGGEPPAVKSWVDTWFVFKAEGRRVYTGVFSTRLLSLGWLRTPVITPLTLALPTQSKETVGFGISFHDPSVPAGAKSPLDPCYDKEIVEAVAKLFLATNSSFSAPVK